MAVTKMGERNGWEGSVSSISSSSCKVAHFNLSLWANRQRKKKKNLTFAEEEEEKNSPDCPCAPIFCILSSSFKKGGKRKGVKKS